MKRRLTLSLLVLLLCGTLSAPRASAQYYALGVNAPLLATGTLNLSLDAAIAPHWSVELPLLWNPIRTEHLQACIAAIQPGIRYWLFEEYAGHFVAAHLAAALYDVGDAHTHYEGWLAGFGVSYGYSWPLSMRWNLALEVGIGAYYMRDTRRQHNTPPLQSEYIYRNHRWVLAPSKFAVSFSYLF